MKNAHPDAMMEALRARKARGLDIKIIIGDPEGDESPEVVTGDDTDADADAKLLDQAPEATPLDGENPGEELEGRGPGLMGHSLQGAPNMGPGSILERAKLRGALKK